MFDLIENYDLISWHGMPSFMFVVIDCLWCYLTWRENYHIYFDQIEGNDNEHGLISVLFFLTIPLVGFYDMDKHL